MKNHTRIPKNHPVQPLKPGQQAEDKVTCGHCGLSWDDAKPTSYTPAPSARCPFEYFHIHREETPENALPEDSLLLRSYVDQAMDRILNDIKWVARFPQQNLDRIRLVCEAVKKGEPLPGTERKKS